MENTRNQLRDTLPGLPKRAALDKFALVMLKSCYYPSIGLKKLKALAERLSQRESYLLREALTDFLRKHETLRPS